jgi:hypothetical protein
MGTQCIPSTGTNASGEAAPATHTARGSTGSSSRTKSRGIAETRGAMDNEVAETPEAKPGSQAVLMSEVRYGIVFGEMNEVFNTRANSLLVFITSLATALAAGGFVSLLSKALDHETVLLWAIGAAIFGALSAAAKVAFKFKERAEQFRVAKKAFQDLIRRRLSCFGSIQQGLRRIGLSRASSGHARLCGVHRSESELSPPSPLRRTVRRNAEPLRQGPALARHLTDSLSSSKSRPLQPQGPFYLVKARATPALQWRTLSEGFLSPLDLFE